MTAARVSRYYYRVIRNYNGITLKREENLSLSRENDAEAATEARRRWIA